MKLKTVLEKVSLILFIISLWLILKYCGSGKYIVFAFAVLTYVFTVSEEYIIKGVHYLKKRS